MGHPDNQLPDSYWDVDFTCPKCGGEGVNDSCSECDYVAEAELRERELPEAPFRYEGD